MNLSKPLIVLAVCLLVLGFSAHKAYAHFPASSGSLTAILHIEPDDNPSAGRPETLYLIFQDSSYKFRMADCLCSLTIRQQGALIYSTSLSGSGSKNTIYDTKGIPFTFPQEGSYQISLDGRPQTAAAFKPFDLNWRVHAGAPLKPVSTGFTLTILKYFATIAAILLILGVAVFLLS